jgi:hypothetical protein
MDNEQLINKYCDYIIDEYIKAGGKMKDVSREATYWGLHGILYREGRDALEKFISNWKPYVRKESSRGYA